MSTLVGAPSSAGADPTIAAAGDIACQPGSSVTSTRCHHAKTANLLSAVDRVLTLGDNQYEAGALSHYQQAYDPTWGVRKAVTSPVPGNHEYKTAGAAGYYDYFGAQAGERGKGYYSYNLGAWHLVALNSNIAMREGSTQNTWLEKDLAANPTACSLTYFHYPRYTAGAYAPGYTKVEPLWTDMIAAHVDVTMAGHDHNYQRWAPQSGVRQFVVGTGGKSHYALATKPAELQASNASTFGVLKLTLHPTSYTWAYVTDAGNTLDTGTASCS
jgi:hypothetical protein